jgi:Uma2 family endonuclease
MSALPNMPLKWTVESYLDFEANSETRHEFINSEVIAMAGASRNHNLIVSRTSARLELQLEKRPCEVYSNDMRVRLYPTYAYPDIIVVCGEPEIVNERVDTLLNPTVIVEVLSPATEKNDYGYKSWGYRSMPSLQAYLLIAQDEMRIIHYQRDSDGGWRVFDITDPDAVINLPSIGCKLDVADLYEKVTFPSDESAANDASNGVPPAES